MQPSTKPTLKEPLPACYNCSQPKSPADPFCRNCGQKHTDLNDSIFHFVAEFITELLSLDGRVFRTLGTLFWRPGELTNEFMRGRRKRYLPPVQIYLFSTFLFFFALGSWAQPTENILGEIQTQPTETASDDQGSPTPESTAPTEGESGEQEGDQQNASSQAKAGQTDAGQASAGEVKPEQIDSENTESLEKVTEGDNQSEPATADTSASEDPESADSETTDERNGDRKNNDTINVSMFNSNMKFDADDFREMANMSEAEIAEQLRKRDVEANPWLVTLLRNSSRLTTELGVQNYYATLVAIASQVALVMLPLVAISLRILFFRSSKSLLQSFVLSSHLHTTTNLILTPLLLFGAGGFWVMGIAALCGGIHGYRALKNVYRESWFWTVFKLGLITGGYIMVLLFGFAVLGAVTLFLT